MKISYNWLRDYLETPLNAEEAGEILTATGLEVEHIETYESVKGGLKGVVVGEVITCTQHPNADRLKLTTVDTGAGELLQIVCGASNVAAGQKVLVATHGTRLFTTKGEELLIKKGKIRGEESQGMICAEDELGLGHSHEGIMVLPAQAVTGTPAAEFLNLYSDQVFEIGLTPNRTDAISHLGVARDLFAALRNMQGISQVNAQLKRPTAASFEALPLSDVSLQVQHAEKCPRYAGLVLDGLKVEPSPAWLQDRLRSIGVKPINNVVDITNYVQHETGQPLHAFDLDKIGGQKVVVRTAAPGEKLLTLDGIERTLHADDLLICDESKPMCIAGVLGGQHSGVSDSTKSIFLESAWFNARSIRQTAKRHGISSDASFRFERGTDPDGTLYAMMRAADLLTQIAGAHIAGRTPDVYPQPKTPARIFYHWQRAATLTGLAIEHENVKAILKDLEFVIVEETAEGLWLEAPTFRTEVTREADVVEEVLRIYGYDHIPLPADMRISVSHTAKPDAEKLRRVAAEWLAANGFAEIMNLSLTSEKVAAAGHEGESLALLNPLSSDLSHLRSSLLLSVMQTIAFNLNYRNSDLRLFEFGKVYSTSNGKYREHERLCISVSGNRFIESWNNARGPVEFSALKGWWENLLNVLHLHAEAEITEHKSFCQCLAYRVGKEEIAVLGEVHPDLLQLSDVKQTVWAVDADWELMVSLTAGQPSVKFEALEKFPAVRRDLSLLVSNEVSYAQLEQAARKAGGRLLRQVGLFDVYEGKNLEAGKKSYALNFILQDAARTLTDKQVDETMERIISALGRECGATLRT